MSAKVFLHIGLPKTATTYLQTILWSNREALADQGVLLPGPERRYHYWCSRIVRDDATFEARATEVQRAAWDVVRGEVAEWQETSVISHEFFAAATAEQARRVVEQLAQGDTEVHLVVTAREPLGLFTASWQESLKNRATQPFSDYSTEVTDTAIDVWNWATLDVRLVLERWAPALPDDRVHVLPLPGRDKPRREIWDRFAGVLRVDADSVDLDQGFPNSSMGVVEAETLRRVNHHLQEFNSAIDRGTYIRTFLADERLVPRRGEPFWPPADRIPEIRQRGREAVDFIEAQDFDVIGDVRSLLVPDDLPERRTPESVTDAEVAQVAVELVATMLGDVRELRHERRRLRDEVDELVEMTVRPSLRLALVSRFPRLQRFVELPERSRRT